MNILIITLRADTGGGPEHVYQLVKSLPASINPIIACPEDKPYYDRYLTLLGSRRLIRVPHRRFSVFSLKEICREIQRRQIHIVHSHGKGAGIYARLASILTGRPCAHTFHGLHVDAYGPLKKKLYFAYERILGRRTDAGICVSQGEQESISSARLIPKASLWLINNGVETPRLRTHQPFVDNLRIIASNRFDYQKNPHLALNIAEMLKNDKNAPKFILTIFGNGENYAACLAEIKRRDLESCVELPGNTNQFRTELRNSHVFLSTSRWEGMPLAILEAMSESLPVVASDVVGNRDAVNHSETGLLYPIENPAAACEALKILNDEPLRAKIGVAARRSVEQRFSLEVMVKKTVEIYSSIYVNVD